MSEQELEKSLDEIAAANPNNKTGVEATADICTEYKKIRPTVVAVLGVLKIIVPKVAAAIETLVALLDGVCSTS